ncbi:unnamed protein product, partial [Ectocarpus sp. 13 AM-2016]
MQHRLTEDTNTGVVEGKACGGMSDRRQSARRYWGHSAPQRKMAKRNANLSDSAKRPFDTRSTQHEAGLVEVLITASLSSTL